MKIIGITGGIGSGKSEVLEYLKTKYQAVVVQADLVGHKVMEPGAPCYEPILALLGEGIKNPDGTVNRKIIGETVFADQALLGKLNAIIHPAVKTYIKDAIARAREEGTQYFVIEAALLLEDDYGAICDEMWYIYTSEPMRRQRLANSRHYTEEYMDQIMEKQLPEEVFRKHCQVVIDNSGSMEETKEQIDQRMNLL